MARINFEGSIRSDDRFIGLVLKHGGEQERAIGSLIMAWELAQQHYVKNDGHIPFDVWARLKFGQQIIDVGLAEISENGVYLCGSNERFGFLRARSENGRKGGINSVISKTLKKQADHSQNENDTLFKQNQANSSKPKQAKQTATNQASYSSSFCIKDSSSYKSSTEINNKQLLKTAENEPADEAAVEPALPGLEVAVAQPAVERLPDGEFLRLYRKYPHKVGKKKGIDKAKREVRSRGEFEKLERAHDRFIEHHRLKGTEARYMPHYSTFISSWTDWLDDDAGSFTGDPGASGGISEAVAEIAAEEALKLRLVHGAR